MEKKNLIILSGFIGFTIGVCAMMLVNVNTQVGCYELIKEIELEVCEECWYEAFDCGDRYEEVEDYVNWE
jgi:hypothetical protein